MPRRSKPGLLPALATNPAFALRNSHHVIRSAEALRRKRFAQFAKEQFSEAYTKINPRRVVPTLVLADRTAIGEVPAILRYLEKIHPNSPLLGTSPKDKALVTMWERRMELEGFAAVMETVRNGAAGLKGRAIAGAHDYEQIPALVERGRQRVNDFYADLESRLADVPFGAGDRFSVADITAIVTADLATKALSLPIPSKIDRNARDGDPLLGKEDTDPAGRPCRIRALVRVGLCAPEHGRVGPARASIFSKLIEEPDHG
jgi:glutathione S-transferase